MKVLTREKILKTIGMHPSRVSNIYAFGSQVYGTNNENSDYDYFIIGKSSVEAKEIKIDDINVHVYTYDKFLADLNWHRIQNFECIYAPQWAKVQEDIKFDNFKLDLNKLRHSISHVNSNSWVKCKKKMEQDENYIGLKSLFHSLRIPMFAIQIIKYGKIIDYTVANEMWADISIFTNWEDLKEKYQPINNKIMSEFKSLAPKIKL